MCIASLQVYPVGPTHAVAHAGGMLTAERAAERDPRLTVRRSGRPTGIEIAVGHATLPEGPGLDLGIAAAQVGAPIPGV